MEKEARNFVGEQRILLCCSAPLKDFATDGRVLWYSFNANEERSTGSETCPLRPIIEGPYPDHPASPSYGFACATIGSELFVVGGCPGEAYTEIYNVFSYDLRQLDSPDQPAGWKMENDMLEPRYTPFMATYNDKLYVIGSVPLLRVGNPDPFGEVYDVKTKRPSSLSTFPFPYQYCPSILGSIWEEKDKSFPSIIWCSAGLVYSLDLGTHTWNDITESDAELAWVIERGRCQSCMIVDDIFYVGFEMSIYAYDLKLHKWFPNRVMEPNEDYQYDGCLLVELKNHTIGLVCHKLIDRLDVEQGCEAQVYFIALEVVRKVVSNNELLFLKPCFRSQTFLVDGIPTHCLAPEQLISLSKKRTSDLEEHEHSCKKRLRK